MDSMKTNLHMRVGYVQRDTSVECHALSIHGCVMYLLLSHKGVTTIVVEFPEKRVCIFNAWVNDKNSSDQNEVWVVLFRWIMNG